VIQIVSYAMFLVSITAVIRKGNGQRDLLLLIVCLANGVFWSEYSGH